MPNSLSNLANSLFSRRQNNQEQESPTPGMLGSGLANKAAIGLLRSQYQKDAMLAQENGEDFPSFEEWMTLRRQ